MKLHALLLASLALTASASLARAEVAVTNLSTRGLVGTGDNVMIVGLVVEGDGADYKPVLLRGIGPLLTEFGLTAIADPKIVLFDGDQVIATNNDWKMSGQINAIRATGFAPANDSESAMIAMLTPGRYTLHLEGTGQPSPANGLAEAYFIEEKSVVANLIAAGDFTTLVAAVQAAGLVDTLNSAGPFTVFAPTDAAFAALPAGTVNALLADIPALTNILLYHVVAGQEIMAAQVSKDPLMMANGIPASLTIEGGAKINGAAITEVDWKGSNGIIHVIDQVILPPANPATRTVVQNLVDQGNFTTLVAAVQAAGLVDTLNTAGPFTVFVPTDAAFAKLPPGTVTALLADIPTLTDILLYHVVSGAKVTSAQVTPGQVTMANGDPATLSTTGGIKINNATVTGADWESSNGVIHFIDTVILPP